MNVYQDPVTLQWVREMKFRDGNWYRCGSYCTRQDAWLAPVGVIQPNAVRIDGPTR